MSQNKCSGCGADVYERETVDAATGVTNTQLVNTGDGKFHMCPSAKPAAKPAASKAKPTKPAPPVAGVKPVSPAPAPLPDAVKPAPTPGQLATREKVAADSDDVLCETAIDIMATERRMTYQDMLATVTKRMMNAGVSKVQAVKDMARDLCIDIEKQGVPISKAAPGAKPAATPAAPVLEDYQSEEGPSDSPDTAALATSHGDDNVAISEYSDEELERGVEVDFDEWVALASRSLLSVEKATKDNLVLKFIKGGKVVKRRSKFEQEVRDKDGNVVLELDAENKPVMEPDGKGGYKPKVKKQRPIQDWVPVTDKAGVEYLLNVNPGMRKMLGKFKNEAGGTFDCWFKLHGEGRGKAYKCEITPVKDK